MDKNAAYPPAVDDLKADEQLPETTKLRLQRSGRTKAAGGVAEGGYLSPLALPLDQPQRSGRAKTAGAEFGVVCRR